MVRDRKSHRLFLVFLVCLVSFGAVEKKAVTLFVTPTACPPPCTVTVRVRVLPHRKNVWVVLLWSDTEKVNGVSSALPVRLDGTSTEILHEVKDLPVGIYLVAAQLFRENLTHMVDDSEVMLYVDPPTH